MSKDRKHVVKKKETLIGIAKKWNHKNWKSIWDAPENAKLKKKRGKPEAIEPKDTLHIPYTDAEKKAIIQAKLALLSLAEVERNLAQAMLTRADATATAGKLALKRHKTVDKDFNDIIKMLKGTVKDTKKMKTGVDVAWAIATLGRDLTKMAKLSKAASKATGKELEALNKEARGEAFNMMKGPVEGQAKKAGTKYLLEEKNEISKIGPVVGTIAEAQDKMTSPSFWFETYVQLKDGKNWSDAVTHDLAKDVASKIHVVDKERIFLTKKLLLEAQSATKAAKEMQSETKKALERAKDIRKDVDAMPFV